MANQAVPIDALPDEVCLQQTPTSQAAIDLISGWISDIPGVKAGEAKLFDDGRAKWALDHLGSVDGHSVLELGPLEAGHTSMLHNAGATITAIEANKRAFVKCLIVKEILRLDRAHFLLGDFMPWLVANTRHFDLVWMTGVLYHMTDPVRLLRLAASCTDRLHLWTHYYPTILITQRHGQRRLSRLRIALLRGAASAIMCGLIALRLKRRNTAAVSKPHRSGLVGLPFC